MMINLDADGVGLVDTPVSRDKRQDHRSTTSMLTLPENGDEAGTAPSRIVAVR